MAGKKRQVLLVSNEKSVRWTLGSALLENGYEVETADDLSSARTLLKKDPTVVFLDLDLAQDSLELLKEEPIRDKDSVALMLHSKKSEDQVPESIKRGAAQSFEKPVEIRRILDVIEDLMADTEIRREVKSAEPIVIGNRETDRFILGKNPKMKKIFDVVERVATSPHSTVLIQGESGVGKEMVAKAVHFGTVKKIGQFMEINCGALPESLLESELFGHEAGSFTDAKHLKKGLIELASGGTLFLDEIGEMPLELQSSILRVIETKRFKRVGGTQDIEVQLRIIAATHQDLQKAVAERRFRQDLFFRLNVVPIFIPPLRERPEDIPILASYFIDFFNRELGRNIRGLSPTARNRLQNYVWPGNVRELRNVLERAILLEDEDRILLHEILIDMPHDMMPVMQQNERDGDFVPITLRELELQAVRQTLAWARGNKTKAAKALGISRQTLREKVRRLDDGALAGTPT